MELSRKLLLLLLLLFLLLKGEEDDDNFDVEDECIKLDMVLHAICIDRCKDSMSRNSG